MVTSDDDGDMKTKAETVKKIVEKANKRRRSVAMEKSNRRRSRRKKKL